MQTPTNSHNKHFPLKYWINVFRRKKNTIPSNMSQNFLLREIGAVTSLEWRIERFLSLPVESDYALYCPAFSHSDAQWYLVIWPYGETGNKSVRWISLYLWKMFSTPKKHAVSYTLGIRRRDGSVFKSFDIKQEFGKYSGYGRPRFVLTSELRQAESVLSTDGTLTVFATLCLTEPTILDEGKIADIPGDGFFRVLCPEEVSCEWKVKDLISLPKENGFSLNSPTFSLAGATWCLQFYPYGSDPEDLGWVSLFLCRDRFSAENQTFAFTLGIQKRDGTPCRIYHHEDEFVAHMAWGCNKLLKSSELLYSKDGLVYEGSVTVFCTVRVNTRTLPYLSPCSSRGMRTPNIL